MRHGERKRNYPGWIPWRIWLWAEIHCQFPGKYRGWRREPLSRTAYLEIWTTMGEKKYLIQSIPAQEFYLFLAICFSLSAMSCAILFSAIVDHRQPDKNYKMVWFQRWFMVVLKWHLGLYAASKMQVYTNPIPSLSLSITFHTSYLSRESDFSQDFLGKRQAANALDYLKLFFSEDLSCFIKERNYKI